jgi:hypothetical protein
MVMYASAILGSASAVLASDSGENHQDEDRGSVAGVNHLTWSGNSANAGRDYGYAAAPMHKRRQSR